MKLFFALLFISTYALAARIPLEIFDQGKLETLLRKNPSAFENTENREGFVRKYYQFPKNRDAGLNIKCHADYFGTATIPSFKACEMEMTGKDFAGDEFQLKIADSEIVKALRSSIPYGDEVKKFFSEERVYGQAYDGAYRELFRYTFTCTRDACNLTYTLKPVAP